MTRDHRIRGRTSRRENRRGPLEAAIAPWAALVALCMLLAACGSDDGSATCGNGVIEGDEQCDDGNTRSGDGCSQFCTVESGWTCTGEPSQCTRTEPAPSDGTSTAPSTPGTAAPGSGSAIPPSVAPRPVCGNGIIEDGEECDDGNTRSGDGCSVDCQIERGWSCAGEPSRCTRLPGACDGVDCSALDSICGQGACNPATGACIVQPAKQGAVCDDEDICTDNPVCVSGVCRGTPRDCTGLGDACAVGVCDPDTGSCVAVPRTGAEGVSCGDPAQPCSPGTCSAGTCVVTALPDGAPCEDPDQVCTVGECVSGACILDVAPDDTPCGSPGPCEVGLCRDGDCAFVPAETGTGCETGNPCTAGICEGTTCVASPVADGQACTDGHEECGTGTCEGGTCVVEPAPDCTPCANGGEYCAGGWCGGAPADRVEDFSEGRLPTAIQTGGDAPWRVVEDPRAAGGYAARSGLIGNNGVSALMLRVDLVEDGEVSFRLRVSSESGAPGRDNDRLRFLVDGLQVATWKGEVDWIEVTFALEAGTRNLSWRYTKDATGSAGQDAAWVDDIRIRGVVPSCGTECGAGRWTGAGCVVCDPVEDGLSCDDENVCSRGACLGGLCEVSPVNSGEMCAAFDDPCQVGLCEDAACVVEEAADGTACGEQGACTTGTCTAGVCEQTVLEDASPCDAGECRTGTCLAGACVGAALEDCTPCGADGADVCASGECGGVLARQVWNFADGQLPPGFTLGGQAPWRVVADPLGVGGHVLRSGVIRNNATSSVGVPVTLVEDSEVRFRFRVSSETGDQPLEYDRLRFFVDGIELASWKGEIPWDVATFPLQAGERRLEWRYTKDGSTSAGQDAAWIDDIRVGGIAPACNAADACTLSVYDGTACLTCPDPLCE